MIWAEQALPDAIEEPGLTPVDADDPLDEGAAGQ